MVPALRATGLLRIVAALFVVFILGLSAALVRSEYEAGRTAARVRAQASAHVVATQVRWTLEASSQALRRIEDTLVRNLDPLGTGSAIADIAEAVSDLPAGYQYSVYDAAGDLRFSSLDSPDVINIADRDYFTAVQGGRELVVSPMVTERLTGEQVFIVARRLDLVDRFAGVATIAIPVSTLANLAESLGMAERSTIGLVRTGGMLIARAPPVEPLDLSGTRLFEALAGAPNGTYDSPVSPADGIARIVGYWSLDGWPLIAVASVERSEALLPFRRALLLWVAIVAPILLASAWLFFRLTRALDAEAERQRAVIAANLRNEFLLREIHHRVKNNMQTVISLIRLQKGLPAELKASLLGRISAMVAVHEETHNSEQFETVEIAPYIRRLVNDVVRGYGDGIGIGLSVDPLRFPGQRAMNLGLLVNELVSNAIKHGLAGRRGGKVTVNLTDRDGTLTLTVADDGPGYDPAAVVPSMGSRLIDAFVALLGGRMEVRIDGGTVVEVTFPRDPQVALAEAS